LPAGSDMTILGRFAACSLKVREFRRANIVKGSEQANEHKTARRSALGQKADICTALGHVCCTPQKADMHGTRDVLYGPNSGLMRCN
jgi:hypothetical protein